LRVSRGLVALVLCCFLATCAALPQRLSAQETTAEQIPVFEGHIKLGVSAIDQDGNASSTIEAYNLSEGINLSRFFVRGVLGETKTISVEMHNTSRHQANASVEFSETGLLNLRFDYSRLRYLESASSSSRSVRDATGVSGNLTPTKWLKLYGGLTDQERRGGRAAFLSEELDFPGSLYDYSIKSRSFGGQVRSSQRSLDANYEWRRFRSEANSPLNREGGRLRVAGTYALARTVSLSGSYLSDESVLQQTEDALSLRSYSGALNLRPIDRVSLSGYVNHKDSEDDVTDEVFRTLSAGGKANVTLRRSIFVEGGYEYTRRSDELEDSDAGSQERKVSTNAILGGVTARFSERARLTLRYRTRDTDRTQYRGLTGPFDSDNFLAKLEGWAIPSLQYALSFEDKERSNDELMSSSWTRGASLFADWTLSIQGRAVGLRFNGQGYRSNYADRYRFFETDNYLVSARVRIPLLARSTAETGITHIDVRGDLDIRKDIATASLEYELPGAYSVEARYDLLSYDDFVSYSDNYVANVFTVSFSKRFSVLERGR